jgi:hypothetical protein
VPAGAPIRVSCAPLRIPAGALKQLAAQLPKAMPRAARSALLKRLASGPPGCSRVHGVPAFGWTGTAPSSAPVVVPALPVGGILSGGPTVMGKDWLTVLVLPAGELGAAGLPAGFPGSTMVWSSSSSSGSAAYSSSVTVSGGPGIDVPGLGGALLRAARPVRGSWGSGRLITTSLLSVLITDGGQVLIGAVQPSVLYADAAQLR